MESKFYQTVLKIALPVTLQSLFQSSFSVVDQAMIGQLGSESIAGIGLGGKFSSLYSVVLSAIAAAAGIMIAQYLGAEKIESVRRSFQRNLLLSLGLAGIFTGICLLFPKMIMELYTKDPGTGKLAAEYLRLFALCFFPMALNSMVSTLLRCMEAASLPMYTGVLALGLNTVLNYLLIFGKGIFPALGVRGAALASVASQIVSCAVLLVLFAGFLRRTALWHGKQTVLDVSENPELPETGSSDKKAGENADGLRFGAVLGPILICEFLWSLGENVYAAVYGNMGTDACAAMTMTIPVQTLFIGVLSGLSQAAGILIGKSLGAGSYDRAYNESKKLIWYGFCGSIVLSILLVLTAPLYTGIYQVDPAVRMMTGKLLMVYALIAPVKVQNMILGGGIVRSGGKTSYIMWVDFIGTWLVGVPLALLSAFVWKLSIPSVYLMLSLEECVRLAITVVIFRTRKWMSRI